MHGDEPDCRGRGGPEPIGPEEVELEGLAKALRYEAARGAFHRSRRPGHGSWPEGDAYLDAWLALETHVNAHLEPVETLLATYKVGGSGELQTIPRPTINLRALIRPAKFAETLRV